VKVSVNSTGIAYTFNPLQNVQKRYRNPETVIRWFGRSRIQIWMQGSIAGFAFFFACRDKYHTIAPPAATTFAVSFTTLIFNSITSWKL